MFSDDSEKHFRMFIRYWFVYAWAISNARQRCICSFCLSNDGINFISLLVMNLCGRCQTNEWNNTGDFIYFSIFSISNTDSKHIVQCACDVCLCIEVFVKSSWISAEVGSAHSVWNKQKTFEWYLNEKKKQSTSKTLQNVKITVGLKCYLNLLKNRGNYQLFINTRNIFFFFFLELETDNGIKCRITINTVYLFECEQIMFTFDCDTWDLLREQIKNGTRMRVKKLYETQMSSLLNFFVYLFLIVSGIPFDNGISHRTFCANALWYDQFRALRQD